MLEEVVDKNIPVLMDELDVCSCNKCSNIVRSLALNSLEPKYSMSQLDEILTRLDVISFQMQVDSTLAIIFAIKKSKKYLDHNSPIITFGD